MKIPKFIKTHLSDSTAIVTLMNPIYSGIETLGAGMSDSVSINSRLLNSSLVYAGLGSLARVRDLSKKAFGITKKTKEVYKGIHDALFFMGCVVGVKPIVYLASGENDWKKITIATGAGVLTAAGLAYPVGYLVDAYRDLTGLEDTGRLPKIIERQSPKTKKTLAALLTGTSVAATAAVYAFNGR